MSRLRERAELLEFELDPVVAAAWLYYHDELNQGDVAELLGVSRPTIVNYLQEARARGIVQIVIAPQHLAPVGLARALKERYKLDGALVIPDNGKRSDPADRIGRAGAIVLAQLLKPGQTLGVAWGRTVMALSTALPATTIQHLSVAQITGSMMATYAFSPELCTSNIAARLGARCVNLYAPGLTSSPKVRAILMREPALLSQFELLRACDAVVFGVADVRASVAEYVFGPQCEPADLAVYVKKGAAALMAGRFVDRTGKHVEGPLDARMIGLTLDEIHAIPQRLCVAGGPMKVDAICAALAGNHPTILVTDERTARAIAKRG